MNRPPSTIWINTFIFAATLKTIGVFTAMSTAKITSDTWAIDRWWGALATGFLLLIALLPWHKLSQRPQASHWQIIGALTLAIAGHQFDLWQSSYASYDILEANQNFQILIGWDIIDVNNVHAFGAIFLMVPVVLACWQYGYIGMWSSLVLTAALYIIAPLWLPADGYDWWFYSVRGFVLLGTSLIVAWIVTNLAQEQQRKEEALRTANTKLAEQAAINEQLATSRERNRLARELHDTLAHSLSGTAVQLEAVQILLKANPEAAVGELKEAREQIRAGLHEARRAITALRATPLEDLGLAGAIEQRTQEIAQRNQYTADIPTLSFPPLPPFTEQTIFRIAEEALTNIEKHAQPDTISVTAGHDTDTIYLIIRDNGRGFDPNQAFPQNHYGLIGMQERATLIEATLTLTSAPTQGTTLRLTIPHNNL